MARGALNVSPPAPRHARAILGGGAPRYGAVQPPVLALSRPPPDPSLRGESVGGDKEDAAEVKEYDRRLAEVLARRERHPLN